MIVMKQKKQKKKKLSKKLELRKAIIMKFDELYQKSKDFKINAVEYYLDSNKTQEIKKTTFS